MEKLKEPKDRYIPRDISWLAFNDRVLAQAENTRNPLLERLKFLAIFGSNQDEFLMVRLATTLRLVEAEYHIPDDWGYFPEQLLGELLEKINLLSKRQYKTYQKALSKELEKNNVFLRKPEDLTPLQKRFVKNFFDTTTFPVMTPIAVDQGRPFPLLPSKTMAFAVQLSRYGKLHLAILSVPRNIPRLLTLPSEKEIHESILIEEIIRTNLETFFRGYKIEAHLLFRLLRDGELTTEEDLEASMLKAIDREIKKRPMAKVVWLETESNPNADLLALLREGLGVASADAPLVHEIDGPLDLSFLFELNPAVSNLASLCYPGFIPAKLAYDNIFDRIKEGDFILPLPYYSFQPTLDLVRTAAYDDKVLAIKMTLYRTNKGSAIIEALKTAAERGKQVTVLVEIRARFDEEQNIRWVKELENAGCHVMYGIPEMKIHSKLTLVVKNEEGRIRRYVHLSTGNYNEKTARLYADIGYFTCNDDVAKDVSDVFNVITGYSMPNRLKRIVTAPNDMKGFLFRMIDQEIESHRENRSGMILAKINSLEDREVIEKLYEASSEGVKIRLIVRGICCLIPGVKGLSENIEVKSIVGRFLEHARFFIFNNNTDARYFISSADWMRRNLDHRIEFLLEIIHPEIKEELQFIWDTQWRDTQNSQQLLADRSYVAINANDPQDMFSFFLEHYGRSTPSK